MARLLQVHPWNTGLAEVGYNLSGEDSEIMTTVQSYKSKGSEAPKADCHNPSLGHNWGLTGDAARLWAIGKRINV